MTTTKRPTFDGSMPASGFARLPREQVNQAMPGRGLIASSRSTHRGVDHLLHSEHGDGLLCDRENGAPPSPPGDLPVLYVFADDRPVTCPRCLEWLHA